MSKSDSPLYIQISDQLRRSVRAGHYKVGDRLPAESQLAEQFGVNRHTLRQAISLLRQEGTLRIERGRGTFVAASPIRYAIGKRVRYNESLRAQGRSVRFEMVRSVQLFASGSVSQALAIPENAPVALIERVSYADDIPVSVSNSYFPLALFPDLLAPERIEQLITLGSISKWLSTYYDTDHIRLETIVSASMVEPQDAKLLAMTMGQPILLAQSINIDQRNNVIEYGVTKFRGDLMEMVFENKY